MSQNSTEPHESFYPLDTKMAVPVMMMKLRVEGFESPFLFVIRLTTKGRHAIDERSVSRHFSLFDEFPNLTDTALSFS